MLSICIPIYNFDVRVLVNALAKQAKSSSETCEIILIDDKSSNQFRTINQETCKQHTYVELPENIGRSRIRNLFLEYAGYDYLLFLDCDVKIISPNFIADYIDYIKKARERLSVVCGGRVYPPTWNEKKTMLRWRYGIKRETFDIDKRKRHPWKSFLSNNFVVNRQIFRQFPFDERLSEYGHEDTLFGYTLKKNGIPIHYIDNAVLNGDVEDNALFLAKTEKGLKNLVKIAVSTNLDYGFIEDSTILRTYFALKHRNLLLAVSAFSWFAKKTIRFLLKQGYSSSLFLFDVYKLFILTAHFKNSSNEL